MFNSNKKTGKWKMFAGVLGLFVLAGGIGAGVILTQEPQLLKQKAAGLIIGSPPTCMVGVYKDDPRNKPGVYNLDNNNFLGYGDVKVLPKQKVVMVLYLTYMGSDKKIILSDTIPGGLKYLDSDANKYPGLVSYRNSTLACTFTSQSQCAVRVVMSDSAVNNSVTMEAVSGSTKKPYGVRCSANLIPGPIPG